jgi:hypothetical protein
MISVRGPGILAPVIGFGWPPAPPGARSVPTVIDVVRDRGPAELIRQVRAAETLVAAGRR